MENTPKGKKNGDGIECCGALLMFVSLLIIIILFPISWLFCLQVVSEYQRMVVFRLGRLRTGAKGPGLVFIIPCIDEFHLVDLRTKSIDVPAQEVLTSDSVTVTVNAVVYRRVQNAEMSVNEVDNIDGATTLLASSMLRNVLGTKTLSEILSDRENISQTMLALLDEATDPWGMKVERVEIMDVSLPEQLQRAMAAEAEAGREARAKVIAAKGEQEASLLLKGAADTMYKSPAALQLRYLQTLNDISAEKNSTIIFPLPMEMLAGFR